MTSLSPKIIAIIPAAGSSSRMGLGSSGTHISKTLLPLGKETVIQRTVKTFLRTEALDEIAVMIRKSEEPAFKQELGNLGGRITLLEGGRTRKESVFNGLRYFQNKYEEQENLYVVVHDAARCFVTADVINNSIQGALKHGAVTTAIPLVDSIKKISTDGQVERSLDREGVRVIQTPQTFYFPLLLKAHLEGNSAATDDACLVEPFHTVHVVEGDRLNFKITEPEDCRLAEALASLDYTSGK